MARFSILGSSGFIGRNLCAFLENQGHDVAAFSRGKFPVKGSHLGHTIYCIGLTSDFRTKPLDTAEAHVGLLAQVIRDYRFESFLYLSSTRVYAGATSSREDAPLTVRPADPDDLYKLSKLAGEAICLSHGFRVARLSNVLGPDDDSQNFMASLLAEVRRDGRVIINSRRESSKDYIDIDDAVKMLAAIAYRGGQRLYNVASGKAVTNDRIERLIFEQTGAEVVFAPGGADITFFPPIDVLRIEREFSFEPLLFEVTFAKLVTAWTTR